MVARLLRDIQGVVHAYAETRATNPAQVTFADEGEYPAQAFLAAAPRGVGAEAAWARQGGAGEGVGFVDVEQGWRFDHPDLVGWGLIAPLFGTSDPGEADHGTAVLDIVVGRDNGSGGIGLAPQAGAVAVCAHRDPSLVVGGDPGLTVADAITAAVAWLAPQGRPAPGHVLLLEVQRPANGYGPSETDDVDLAAIRTAIGNDVVVVEAAGNGLTNVDGWRSPTGRGLTTTDSGAIVVAGSMSAKETEAVPSGSVTGHRININKNSNYGTRVNCYAWGGDVVTASAAGGYQIDFDGTSSASAIIAGVAVVVQGMYRAAHGDYLRPAQMRALLTGGAATPQVPVASRANLPIGVMPDLKALVETVGALERVGVDALSP